MVSSIFTRLTPQFYTKQQPLGIGDGVSWIQNPGSTYVYKAKNSLIGILPLNNWQSRNHLPLQNFSSKQVVLPTTSIASTTRKCTLRSG
jgi:hypothetical protein